MHVALLIPGLDRIAGAERQVLLLACELSRRGWRVTVIALSGEGGDAAHSLNEAGIDFFSLNMRKGVADPRGWMRLQRWLRANRPDILHAHLPHASWMARVSRVIAPVRAVIDTIHTSAVPPLSRRLAYRFTARLSDCITAVSEGVAASITVDGVARPETILVVPNGIDTSAWAPDSAMRVHVRAELGLRDEFLWCTVGRLEPVKDHALLLRALAALPAHAHVAIAGSGSLKPELLALARELRLEKRVRFLGFQPDPCRWLQAADGFALASHWEGLPMSLLEAGACAVPSVATNVCGVRDIIGSTGFVATPGDVESFRSAMLRLMSATPEERLALGMRARHRIVERFAVDTVLDAWERLYGEMLADRPKRLRFARRMRSRAASTVAPPSHRPA